MTKIQHGNYDEARKLPDNTGQPSDSGLYVWLCDQVSQRIPGGTILVEQCHAHGVQRYAWLVEQVAAMQTEDGAQFVNEFDEKRKRIEAGRRQAQRRTELQRFEQRLEERPGDTWLPKKIVRIQREIAKAEARWKFDEQ